MATDKQFTTGLIVKQPRDGAPDFVKGSLSIKVAEFIPFLEAHAKGDGWVNIDLKEGKSGKWYGEINSWTKPTQEALPTIEITELDSPF